MDIGAKTYYPAYQQATRESLAGDYAAFDFSGAFGNLGYQTSASAVFSSNIEGNRIDLNSFVNLRLAQRKFKQKEVEEIEIRHE